MAFATTFHRRWALIAIVAILQSPPGIAITIGETDGLVSLHAPAAHHWREAQSCGVACGYMLARLLGSEITYDDAVAAIPIEKGGSSLLGLQEGLAALGVSATVLRAKPRDLDHFATPLIAHVLPRRETSNSVGHFLLVLRIDERSVRYIEPNYAASIETVPRSQFVRCWSGYLILPESTQDFPSQRWLVHRSVDCHRSVGVDWWFSVRTLGPAPAACVLAAARTVIRQSVCELSDVGMHGSARERQPLR